MGYSLVVISNHLHEIKLFTPSKELGKLQQHVRPDGALECGTDYKRLTSKQLSFNAKRVDYPVWSFLEPLPEPLCRFNLTGERGRNEGKEREREREKE